MANRYWVGGNGTWDATTTTHWSATSGGSSGASVPTASDSVFFDSNSGANPTVTCTGALTCLSFNVTGGGFPGFVFAISGSPTLAISGSVNLAYYCNFNAALPITLNSTTTGNTLYISGGISFAGFGGGVTFNGSGGEWICTSNFSAGQIGPISLVNGTLRLDTYTVGGNKFSTGVGTKTLDFGSTGILQVSNSTTTTVWDTGTNLANTTFTGTGKALIYLASGSGLTQTVFIGAVPESNAFNFAIDSFAVPATVTLTANDAVRNISTGNSQTILANTVLTVYGDVNAGVASGTNAWTFASSSTQTIYSSALDLPINFSGTGTVTLNNNFTNGATRTTTLTAGTLSLNTYTFSTGSFVVSGSSTKSINFGTGSIQNNSTGNTTVWNSSAGLTGFSSSGTGGFIVTGTTGTKTINTGAIPEAAAVSFTLQNTAGTVAFTAGDTVKNLTLNGTFTLSNIAITIYGNTTVTSVTTLTAGSNAWTFGATSGTKTISNPWGSTWTFPLNFNGAGGTFQLQSAISTNRAVAGVITLTNGTLDLNGYTLTISAVTLSTFLTAAGTKNITFNGGSIVIATPIATAFNNAAPTGFTTTAGTGVGSISMSGTTAKTFVGAGSTFACALNNGGAGALTVSGANTFNDITSTYAASTAANTITFPASTTTTVSALTGTGASGRLLTLNSGTVGTQATIALSGGGTATGADYLSVTDIAFTPFATDGTAPYKWYLGANSVNGGRVTGALFQASGIVAYALASGTSFTTPADWNNSNNTIHIFGAGGGGAGGLATSGVSHTSGSGGGGGGYTKLINQTISGAIAYAIGAAGTAGAAAGGVGGAGGTTTWNTTNTALGGNGGIAGGGGGGAGGTGSTFNGGAGGSGTSNGSAAALSGASGGGAGGPNGTGGAGSGGSGTGGGGGGGNGGGTAGTANGGAGGNNSAGTGGGTAAGGTGTRGGGGGGGNSTTTGGGLGGIGIDVLNTIGGGGGTGASYQNTAAKNATAYAAGGAGGGTSIAISTGVAGGAGGGGLIVVVYTPGSTPVISKGNFFFLF